MWLFNRELSSFFGTTAWVYRFPPAAGEGSLHLALANATSIAMQRLAKGSSHQNVYRRSYVHFWLKADIDRTRQMVDSRPTGFDTKRTFAGPKSQTLPRITRSRITSRSGSACLGRPNLVIQSVRDGRHCCQPRMIEGGLNWDAGARIAVKPGVLGADIMAFADF
jgi:hypothetical protein